MRVLIVDDEKPARDRLRRLIDDFGTHEVVGEAANGEQAISLATELAPEVVLLDIRMPGVDGIETAHHLNAMESPPAVVFTTAYDEYAIDAFDAQKTVNERIIPVKGTLFSFSGISDNSVVKNFFSVIGMYWVKVSV